MPLKSGFVIGGVHAGPDVPKIGTTTGAGAANGSTLVDTNALTEATADQWRGQSVLVLSGANLGLSAAIVDFNPATDTLTLSPAFPAQVASGVKYAILSDVAAAAVLIIGADNSNDTYDTSNVTSNRDGNLLQRSEWIIQTLAEREPVTFTPSSSPSIDEDGGRAAVHVSIVDRNTGGVAVDDINITGVTYELAKSTGGGAFNTAGVTQPTGATKAAGEVELAFDFDPAEWAVGDVYRLKLGAVTATVAGTTYHMGTLTWVGEVVEDVDVKAAVDDINTDLGEPDDATTDTVHGKIGTDTEMADQSLFDLFGGAEIVTPAVTGNQDGDLRDRIDALSLALGVTVAGSGNGLEEDGTSNLGALVGIANLLAGTVSGDRDGNTIVKRLDAIANALGVSNAGAGSGFEEDGSLDLYETLVTGQNSAAVAANRDGAVEERLEELANDTDAILADTGDGTDGAVAPGVGGSIHGHIREAQENIDTVQTEVNKIGANTEAATDPSAATGTLFSKLRGAGDNLDTIIAELANGTYGLSALETLVDDIESRLTAARATLLDNLDWQDVSTGETAWAAESSEKTLFEVTSITTPTEILASINMKEVDTAVLNATIRVYVKVWDQDAGTWGYEESQDVLNWTNSDPNTVDVERKVLRDYKITVTPSGSFTGDVSWAHSRSVKS